MKETTAGIFKITVSDPYPCWCNVIIDGEIVGRVRHDDLRDLNYVSERAMQHARNFLPQNEKEEV